MANPTEIVLTGDDGSTITLSPSSAPNIVLEGALAGPQGIVGPSGVLTAATFTTNGSVKQTVYNVRDYGAVGDGVTDDSSAIQTAIMAANVAGGEVLFPQSVYIVNAPLTFTNVQNVTIRGTQKASAIIKAGSGFVGAVNYRTGILNFKNGVSDLNNITIENLTLDANNVTNCPALVVSAGLTSYNMNNFMVKDCIIKNTDSSTPAVMVAAGISTTLIGPFGTINGLVFDGLEAAYNGLDAILFDGFNHNNVRFTACNFHDNGRSAVYLATDGFPGGSNWTVKDCRFVNNKIGDYSSTGADFHDKNLSGIKNLEIENNYFGPTTLTITDNFNLTIYNSEGLRIKNNFFEGPGGTSAHANAAMAIGASKASNYYRTDSDRLATIEGNTFYKVRAAWDGDSTYLSRIIGNLFFETQYRPIVSGYSNHYATLVEGNILYNCNTSPPDSNDYSYSGIYVNAGDGVLVKNNYVLDSRLLRNPTTGPSLSSTTAGSLGARTYYAKITWSNDTGETLASSETNLSILANKLVTVTLPSTLPAGPPHGAKYANIYLGTSSGSETLQASISVPNKDSWTWTEPLTGLIAGAALPVSNTTAAKTRYGICEVNTSTDSPIPNIYSDNIFSGMTLDGIFLASGSTSIIRNNNGTNTSAGSVITSYVAKSSTYSITTLDSVINCTSGTFTVTLPTAIGVTGREYKIINSGTGVVTVATTSSQTIDGSTTASIPIHNMSLTVVSNGANWQII